MKATTGNSEHFRTIDKFIHFSIGNYLYYHSSIESYLSREQPDKRRKFFYYCTMLLCLVCTIKYGLLIFYHDHATLLTLGEPMILFQRHAHLVYAMLFSLGIVICWAKSMTFYYELKYRYHTFDQVYNLKKQTEFYKLKSLNRKHFLTKINMLFRIYIQGIGDGNWYSNSLLYITLVAVDYFYYDLEFNLLILLFNTIFSLIFVRQILVIVLGGAFRIFLLITFFNYKLDELIDKIKLSVHWSNKQGLYSIILNYNELTKKIMELSPIFNMIIGLVYFIVPYCIALNVEVIKIEGDSLTIIGFRICSIIVLILTLVNAYMINLIVASITVRNTFIPKYLYPVFCGQSKTDLKIKLKIESFIARIDEQFIGYHCFNLFEFTKLSFYQYMTTIITTYCLIYKMSN